MAIRLPLSTAVRALIKAASNCPVQQPRAISVRYVPTATSHPRGTKTASQPPPTVRNYLDVPAQVTKAADSSLMQDLQLPTDIQATTERLLTQKAAAILGPLEMQALGPGAPDDWPQRGYAAADPDQAQLREQPLAQVARFQPLQQHKLHLQWERQEPAPMMGKTAWSPWAISLDRQWLSSRNGTARANVGLELQSQ